MTLTLDTPTLPHADQSEIWQSAADALDPPEPLSPSEFAERYRVLHEIYCSERPGPWSSDVFPYQRHVMDAAERAIRDGKKGIVFMKAGQIGGTDSMINVALWCKVYFPGPQLFMTSTEKVAQEFGRERFELVIRDMPPLAGKRLPGRESILTKRFSDGKIQLSGGQSVFNLQSTPYKVVTIDELDSLVADLGGSGDPIKLAEVRTDSFTGPTLIIAYAHPSSRDRGAAQLYYDQSDQQRGFVRHECGAEFYWQWEHVKPGKDPRDPDDYLYFCPTCGAAIPDAERVKMTRETLQYRSVLPPEVAKKKAWAGVHASQLYSPSKTIRSFAQLWIESDLGRDDAKTRVFYNKKLGEPHEAKVQSIEIDALRSLVVISRRTNDPEFYTRGQVPPWVQFLTAGQDSRTTEFHHAIWGWGLRRTVEKTLVLCGALVDWGTFKREYSLNFTESEFHPYDDLIYTRLFPSSTPDQPAFQVRRCCHDIGYGPTQTSIIRYCRNWTGRATAAKGASNDHTSASKEPPARWGNPIKFKVGDVEIADESSRALILNTFLLKNDWYGWTADDRKIEIMDAQFGNRKVSRLVLPPEALDDTVYLEQSKNEAMQKGKRAGEMVWRKTGPNHYADCNTQALGAAFSLDPFLAKRTAQEEREHQRRRRLSRPMAAAGGPAHDPAMG